MTCASVELLDAMQGVGPRVEAVFRYRLQACDLEAAEDTTGANVFGWLDRHEEDTDPVTCPACLLLMREATEPVRYDALLERGAVGL